VKKAELSSVSRPEILDSIKDEKSLRLLSSLAKGEQLDTEDLSILLEISRKEYYLRMSKFVKTGIVTRRQGKYMLTSFGKVIYELQLILVEAIDMKLKTFDSFIPNPFGMEQNINHERC
jgi:predicted transcriptional regulator